MKTSMQTRAPAPAAPAPSLPAARGWGPVQRQPSLDDLPSDLVQQIAGLVPAGDQGRLAQTNRRMNAEMIDVWTQPNVLGTLGLEHQVGVMEGLDRQRNALQAEEDQDLP